VTDPHNTRADSTRQHILRAAARQFAHRSYSVVNLDDILAEAQVTKGAMYFHFRSKHALALAIIDEQTSIGRAAVNELLARKLTGLETLVDISCFFAVQDLSDDLVRAGLHLLESIGRTDGLQANVLGDWIKVFAVVVRRAMDEGDIVKDRDPEDISSLLVSLYMGIRQTSDLDRPDQFLNDLQKTWTLVLPSFANPERTEYLNQFIARRRALAMSKTSVRPGSTHRC
jgi:AcrR family transcriptional regulator